MEMDSEVTMEIIIGTTAGSKKEARKIAASCMEQRIAACAHIDKVESSFIWEGEVHNDVEYRVNLKTTEAAYEAVAKTIQALHSYDEPAIFCTPITGGSESYLKWIQDNSSGHTEVDTEELTQEHPPAERTKQMSVYISSATWRALQYRKLEEGRSMTDIVNDAIAAYLKRASAN
jgi:periplasmic divalent cation tolerance protein